MDSLADSGSHMTGCFGIKHNLRWCSFLMIALFSWATFFFSIVMIILTIYAKPDTEPIRYDQLIIWTNLMTVVIGVWLPTPKNKEKTSIV